MPPPADIVKVAIEWPGAYPKLMEIDQVSHAGSSLGVLFSLLSVLEFSQTLVRSFVLLSLSGCAEKSVQ